MTVSGDFVKRVCLDWTTDQNLSGKHLWNSAERVLPVCHFFVEFLKLAVFYRRYDCLKADLRYK